jgi:peptidoglycan/xylan/chitin deacetylase (PgdA/CDA1 family)
LPSFQQHLQTLALWRALPGRERIERPAAVALTFDDGPDPDSTPAVLDALDAAAARATFFVVVEQLRAHPELAREAVERGHEVGLHGLTHEPFETVGEEEIATGLAEVERLCGARPRVCRPPYGRFTPATWEAARGAGLEPVYWSAWGEDWEPLAPERIAELVIRDLEPGAIVLLHDSPRYAHRPTAHPTADAVPLIAAAARGAGLNLEPVSPA